MTPTSFFWISFHCVIDGSLMMYSVDWLIYFVYLVFIVSSTLRKNWRLVVMVLAMILNATASIMYYSAVAFSLSETWLWVYTFAVSADLFVHWMFCYTYLKLSIEVKFMFDRRIYTNDPEVIQEINRYNFCLNIAHVINIAICVGLLVSGIVVKTSRAA